MREDETAGSEADSRVVYGADVDESGRGSDSMTTESRDAIFRHCITKLPIIVFILCGYFASKLSETVDASLNASHINLVV